MKLKLGILFLILAACTVAGVFYAKDYISYDIKKPQAGQSAVKSIEPITDIKNIFTSYADKPYADNLMQESILKSYDQGDLVIVHFWASWCAPCVNEIPEIIQFMKKNRTDSKGESKKIQFIAVNLDSDTEDIQKFLKSFPELDHEPFVRIWDKNNLLSKYYDVDKLPASVFLQKDKPFRKTNGAVDWLQF